MNELTAQTAASGPATARPPALKEWALTCRLLLEGRQSILLRKGGIDEKGFWIAAPGFYLFPTYLHQHRARVRDAYHADFDRAIAQRPAETILRIDAWAEVLAAFEVNDARALASLPDLHPYSPEHIEERLTFRPKKPPVVAVVRARPLLEPVELPMDEAYAGCLSWVDVDVEDVELGNPAIGDAELAGITKRIRDLAV
jgi:hypothetical protein